jgi:hypothetical protein
MILLLKDRAWTIWASGWSACAQKGSGIVITYPWYDITTMFGAGNGVTTVELNMTEAQFEKKISRAFDICDLREYCK